MLHVIYIYLYSNHFIFMKNHFTTINALLIAGFLIAIGCGEKDPHEGFRMEKRYWDVSDYQNAVYQVKTVMHNGEKKPCYGSNRQAVFLKIVDENNLTVVTNDTALGIKHRSDFAEALFEVCRDLDDLYTDLDNQDKYLYPRELVDILRFGLEVQIQYFKLGNDKILKEADNPNDAETQRVIRSNAQTIIGNFNHYLDLVNQEGSLSPEAISHYASGIDVGYKRLTEAFPTANYAEATAKADLMLKKAASQEIKKSLTNLIAMLHGIMHKDGVHAAGTQSVVAASLK